MADFIGRLAERTMGVAPVVRPVIAPMFASEPEYYSAGLAWEAETATSFGDPDRAQAPPAAETPLEEHAVEGLPGENTALTWREEPGVHARSAPPHTDASGVSYRSRLASSDSPAGRVTDERGYHGPAVPDASSNPRVAGTSESVFFKQDPLRAGPRHPQGTPRALLHPAGSLVGLAQGATPPSQLSPSVWPSAEPGVSSLDSETAPGHSTLPTTTPRPVPPTLADRSDTPAERSPREIHLAADESPAPPTVRVNIGRVEVRAITPPPARAARRTTPARPSPALSLDEYLRRRNEGER